MPYVTNPLTLAYGNRHYGAGPADGYSGPGYGGNADLSSGASSLMRAVMGRLVGPGVTPENMQQQYYASLAAKTGAETQGIQGAQAAEGRISDLFKQARDQQQYLNDQSDMGDYSRAFAAKVPMAVAAETPFLTPEQAKALPDTYRFAMANEGAATGQPTFGTTAITRAVVGAGGNEGNVKGAILADQPPGQQALAVGPTDSQVKAAVIQGLPAGDKRVAALGQPAYGASDSQVKGAIIPTLSPADQRTAALGPAGNGSFAPTPVMVAGPDGKPMAAVGMVDHHTGAITVPTQNGAPLQSPPSLAAAVTGPVAAPDGSLPGGSAQPGALPSAMPPQAPIPPSTPDGAQLSSPMPAPSLINTVNGGEGGGPPAPSSAPPTPTPGSAPSAPPAASLAPPAGASGPASSPSPILSAIGAALPPGTPGSPSNPLPAAAAPVLKAASDALTNGMANAQSQGALLPAASAPAPVASAAPQPFGVVPKASATVAELTPEALKREGAAYNQTGQISAGFGGQQMRVAIMNEAARQAAAQGLTPQDVILARSANKADQGALLNMGKTNAMLQSNVGAARKEMALVAQLAPAGLSNTGVPAFNRWVQAGRKNIEGDPAVTALNAAVVSAVNEYAKAISTNTGGGGAPTSDAARDEANSIINQQQTLPGMLSALKTMDAGLQNRLDGQGAAMDAIRRRIASGESTPSPGGASASPASNNAPSTVIRFDAQGNRLP